MGLNDSPRPRGRSAYVRLYEGLHYGRRVVCCAGCAARSTSLDVLDLHRAGWTWRLRGSPLGACIEWRCAECSPCEAR